MESTKQTALGTFEVLPPLVIPAYPLDILDYQDALPAPSDEELTAYELDYHRTYGDVDFTSADTEEKVAYRELLELTGRAK